MAKNVKLMQEAALVDPNRGTDLGPKKIYENLRLEISSLQCRESREKVVKEFIYQMKLILLLMNNLLIPRKKIIEKQDIFTTEIIYLLGSKY